MEESNVLRWNFHPTSPNNPNAWTIFIEGRPLSLFLGYRVAKRVHLFNRDFSSYFKCVLITKYLGVMFNDTYLCTRDLSLSENLQTLKFTKHANYSPYICLNTTDDSVFYLDQSSYKPPKKNTIYIKSHPTIKEFVEKMDIKLVFDFLVVYLKQKNISVFNKVILDIIYEWVAIYNERDCRETPIDFFRKISPSDGDFFLFHSLVDYVASLQEID